MWVGNIEIHDKASDWYAHGHDKDKAYDNVVLHVAAETGQDIITSDGRKVAQIRLDVPQEVSRNYDELITTDHYPPCYAIIPQLSRLTVHSWMSRLQAERLEQKTDAIRQRPIDAAAHGVGASVTMRATTDSASTATPLRRGQ